MKTPSAFPVLDNRPIDQWKVTELKEELKRRKLITKGLKDDLVRRLDEALRNELESAEEENVNNDTQVTPEPVVHADDSKAVDDTPQPIVQTEDVEVLDDTPQPEANADSEGEKALDEKTEMMACGNNADSKVTNEESLVPATSVETNALVDEVLPSEGKIQDNEGTGSDLVKTEENFADVTSVKTSVTVTKSVTYEVSMDVQESLKDDLKTQFESQKGGLSRDQEVKSSDVDGLVSEVSTDVAIQVTQLEAEVAKPPQDDVKLNSADPSDQVSEVNTVLGFQVKSDSISSDSVFINEKNELKDNIIDENVKLELDVKPEMVHPSSSNIMSDEPHPMDVEEPGDKKEPVEEVDERNVNLDMSKKNDSNDVGLSEKLNLDRSSGDDSIDDDIMENKPIDSKYNSEGVEDLGVKNEGSAMEEAPVVMTNDIPADKKVVIDEMKKAPAAPIVKRKFNDEVAGNNEISKRQRKWNTGNIKIPEPQSNTVSSTTTPKETFPTPTLKRSFSRSDTTANTETPKERVVLPSSKPPTTSLRIDQFLRPFTLKAVQELLGKTGSVISFWMDHIKTHCYVTYSSVEEAIETRNAVYNLQWPPNGGRHLLAEFVDPQEVKAKVEASPSPATPVATSPSVPPQPPAAAQPHRQQVQRQQALAPPPSLPPPPPLSNPPQARERLPPPPPQIERIEKMDTPIVTLDDLFRKTKATPRIYYLPLSDEQVAEKRRKMKQ